MHIRRAGVIWGCGGGAVSSSHPSIGTDAILTLFLPPTNYEAGCVRVPYLRFRF